MILESLVGGSADNLITFDKAIQGKEPLIGDKRQVELESITDKDLRSKIHQVCRFLQVCNPRINFILTFRRKSAVFSPGVLKPSLQAQGSSRQLRHDGP